MDVAGGSEVCISLKSVHCALLTRSCFQPPGEEAEPHPRLLNAEPPECGHQGRGIYFYITVIILKKTIWSVGIMHAKFLRFFWKTNQTDGFLMLIFFESGYVFNS